MNFLSFIEVFRYFGKLKLFLYQKNKKFFIDYICLKKINIGAQILIIKINFNFNKMKKTRTQKPVVPISLSSKRGSLNHEQLFTPYKIDWKGTPLQSMDNNTSKNFFQTMKSELSNIKNDFEKLIKKESTSKSEREDSIKHQNYVKSKCQSVFKKIEKPSFENKEAEKHPECAKIDLIMNPKESEDNNCNSILALQRNLPCSMTYDLKLGNKVVKSQSQGYHSQTPSQQSYQNRQKPILIENSELFQQSKTKSKENNTSQELLLLSRDEESANIKLSKVQILQKKQKMVYLDEINKMKEEIDVITNQSILRKKECQKLISENKAMIFKLEKTEKENNQKQQKINNLQIENKELSNQLSKLTNQFTKLSQKNEENNFNSNKNFEEQRSFLINKLDQISFHHQNLLNINNQVSGQNDLLRQNVFCLQRFVEEMKQRCQDVQNDYKRKIQHIQKEINEYQKREDMFSRQIDQLTLRLSHQSTQLQLLNKTNEQETISENFIPSIGKQQQPSHEGQIKIEQLTAQVQILRKQVKIERQLHDQLRQRMQIQLKNQDFKQLGEQFQTKINESVEQIYKLRNKISHLQANIHTLELTNQSLQDEVKLYIEREDSLNNAKSLKTSQWEQIMQENDRLKEQNKNILQKYQFELMKRENQSINKNESEIGQTQRQKINDILKNHIHEVNLIRTKNENLMREVQRHVKQIAQLETRVEKYSNQLEIQKIKNKDLTQIPALIIKIEEKHQKIQKQLEKKKKEIQSAHHFIHKVMVQKIHKKEQEQQIDYLLRELQQIFNERA